MGAGYDLVDVRPHIPLFFWYRGSSCVWKDLNGQAVQYHGHELVVKSRWIGWLDPMGPMAHLARVLTEDGTPVEAPKKLPGIPMSPTRSLTSNDLKWPQYTKRPCVRLSEKSSSFCRETLSKANHVPIRAISSLHLSEFGFNRVASIYLHKKFMSPDELLAFLFQCSRSNPGEWLDPTQKKHIALYWTPSFDVLIWLLKVHHLLQCWPVLRKKVSMKKSLQMLDEAFWHPGWIDPEWNLPLVITDHGKDFRTSGNFHAG